MQTARDVRGTSMFRCMLAPLLVGVYLALMLCGYIAFRQKEAMVRVLKLVAR